MSIIFYQKLGAIVFNKISWATGNIIQKTMSKRKKKHHWVTLTRNTEKKPLKKIITCFFLEILISIDFLDMLHTLDSPASWMSTRAERQADHTREVFTWMFLSYEYLNEGSCFTIGQWPHLYMSERRAGKWNILWYIRGIYIYIFVVVYLGAGGENRQPAYAPLFSIM